MPERPPAPRRAPVGAALAVLLALVVGTSVAGAAAGPGTDASSSTTSAVAVLEAPAPGAPEPAPSLVAEPAGACGAVDDQPDAVTVGAVLATGPLGRARTGCPVSAVPGTAQAPLTVPD